MVMMIVRMMQAGGCLMLAFVRVAAQRTFFVHLQGALTVVSKEPGTVKRVESQLKQVLVWGLLPEESISCLILRLTECEAQFFVWMCCLNGCAAGHAASSPVG